MLHSTTSLALAKLKRCTYDVRDNRYVMHAVLICYRVSLFRTYSSEVVDSLFVGVFDDAIHTRQVSDGQVADPNRKQSVCCSSNDKDVHLYSDVVTCVPLTLGYYCPLLRM